MVFPPREWRIYNFVCNPVSETEQKAKNDKRGHYGIIQDFEGPLLWTELQAHITQ
jgi:hypothetical protein